MSRQSERLNRIRIHATEQNGRLFRNNVGEAWAGKTKWIESLKGKIIQILNPSRIKFGLTEGSSDLIGWKSIIITPSMIGRKIAVFWAVEEKTGKDKLSEKQANFLNQVNEAGGIAELAITERNETRLENVNGAKDGFLW